MTWDADAYIDAVLALGCNMFVYTERDGTETYCTTMHNKTPGPWPSREGEDTDTLIDALKRRGLVRGIAGRADR